MKKSKGKMMKPVNITKDDDAYREFLQQLLKVKSRNDFFKKGLTLNELDRCINQFYKTLNEMRLTAYNLWIEENKNRIYEDLKKIEKKSKVEAPDNAVKTEIFNNFVDVICELLQTDEFEDIVQDTEAIVTKLFKKTGEKPKLPYVKRYLKDNMARLKKATEDLSSEADESENEAEEDANVSEIEERMKRMDTDDSASDRSFNKSFVKDLTPTRQSTPKKSGAARSSSEISPGKSSRDGFDTLLQMANKIVDNVMNVIKGSEKDQNTDSGFSTTNPTETTGYTDTSSGKHGNGRESEVLDSIGNETDLSSNIESSSHDYNAIKIKDTLYSVVVPAVGEESGINYHLLVEDQARAGPSHRISQSSHDNTNNNESSRSRRSERTKTSAKRSIASIEDDNVISNTGKNDANIDYKRRSSKTSKSINQSHSSEHSSIHDRRKRFKSASTNDHVNSATRTEDDYSSNEENYATDSVVSVGNIEISFNKLPSNNNHGHVSTPAKTNTTSEHESDSGIKMGNYGLSSANSSASVTNQDESSKHDQISSNDESKNTTWDSHKHRGISSHNSRGYSDSQHSESFKTALTSQETYETQNSTSLEKSPSSVDHDSSYSKE